MIVARICRAGHFSKGNGPCPECPKERDLRATDMDVQVGMIDGEQIGYFPPEAGPYVAPGRSIKRVLKNNRAWHEMIKRSEGKYGDIS